MIETDFLIIGGGVIGLSIARELKKSFPDAKVCLIEKEKDCGLHASGRNSGVLHAGFYYTEDSLKARFTRDGNRQLTEYCESRNIPVLKCGKLVVTKDEKEEPFLDILLKRGQVNGVDLRLITAKEAKDIDPRVKTFKRALFSPNTSSVDPVKVLNSIQQDAVKAGVVIHTGTSYLKSENDIIFTSREKIKARYSVNAAGLYADKIALNFGFSKKHRILPFKGLYLYSNEPAGSLKVHVYPVPDLRNPFLGVHFTITPAGKLKIGPTAIPVFWREQYGWDNFDLNEFLDISFRQISLMAFSQFDLKKLAYEELKKYSKKHLVSLASQLVEKVHLKDYTHWGPPGIRAQLVNLEEKKLEMDFVIESDRRSMHVLNTVSPGFTCAFTFSKYVCEEIKKYF